MTHIINGNIPHNKEPSIPISLSDRLPPFPQGQASNPPHVSAQPIRLFDLLYPNPSTEHPDPIDDPIPIQLFLRYRPHQTTPSLTAPPILPTTARRPLHQRSGRRRTVRVRHRKIINHKAPKPRKRARPFHPSPPTTPPGTVEIRNSQNSELTSEATSPAPPPSGAPGVVSTTFPSQAPPFQVGVPGQPEGDYIASGAKPEGRIYGFLPWVRRFPAKGHPRKLPSRWQQGTPTLNYSDI